MAIVDLTILEGRSQQTKDALIDGLTAVVVQLLGAKPEQVRVVIREVRSGGYGVAGRAVYLSPSEPIQARPEP